jgi:hypothetical protein
VGQFTVRIRVERDHGRATPRRLTLTEHGLLELLAGLALIGAPLVLGLGPIALMAGVGAGALVAGLGLADGLPISTHVAADAALAALLLTAAAAFIAAGEPVAATMLACAAAAELALTVTTRWTRR